MWIRMTPGSDVLRRLSELENKAHELGLSFSFDLGGVLIHDEKNNKIYHMLDVESDVNYLDGNAYVYDFPSNLEYKLCREVKNETPG